MARKLWAVVIEDLDHFEYTEQYRDQYIPSKGREELLSIFFTEKSAKDSARHLAEKYPGKEVHVLKQTYGFAAQATPVEEKIWTEQGNYVPHGTT